MRNESKAPSQRQLKVGQEVRRILGRAFSRSEVDLRDIDSRSVTITEVRVSPDLKHARVYVSLLQGEKDKVFLDSLKESAPFCRKILARELRMKVVPVLKFALDETLETSKRIESLFRDPKVKRDIERTDSEE